MGWPGKLAMFVGAEIILLVTPLMFPQIAPELGYAAYACAVLLLLYGVSDYFGWLPRFGTVKEILPLSDWKQWDRADVLELYEAACLWVGEEPRLPLPRRARRRYVKMVEAILVNKLRADFLIGRGG